MAKDNSQTHSKKHLSDTIIEGKVEIEFGFPDMKDKSFESSQKAESVYKIKGIYPFISRNMNDRELNELKALVKKGFDIIKSSNLNQYLSTVQLGLFE